MEMPFPPGEPSEQKPEASSSLIEQTGAPNDLVASPGNTDNDEVMRENDLYDTPGAGAGAENRGGHLVAVGGGLPMQTLPLRITAGPSNLGELPHIQGPRLKRPRVDTPEEQDHQSGAITVELPKSHQAIRANQVLTQQVRTLKSLYQSTLDGHARTLEEYRNDVGTYRRTMQERINQTEAAAQEDRKRADELQAFIKDCKEAQVRAASEAAEREQKMIQTLTDMKNTNEELLRVQEQIKKDRDEAAAEIERLRLQITQVCPPGTHQDPAGSTSNTHAEHSIQSPKDDVDMGSADGLDAIRRFVQEKEDTANIEKQRADELQAALNAKNEEAEIIHRREAKVREQAAALKIANDDLVLKQAETERKMAAERERMQAEKEREVSSAQMKMQRETNARAPGNTATGNVPAATSTENHVMSDLPETSSAGAQKGPQASEPPPMPPPPPPPGLGRSVLKNMRTKKASMQERQITRLRPRTPPPRANDGVADRDADGEEGDDEDEGDGEEDIDDDDDDDNEHDIVKQEVGVEAKALSKDARNTISLKIRRVIKNAFELEELEDWAMHVPATPEMISAFDRSDIGSGPDPGELRMDMIGKINSTWNTAVIQILLALVLAKLEEDSSWLPKVSDTFLRTRIEERLAGARTTWRAMLPKTQEDGKKETAQQVENRVVNRKTLREAANRAGTRRCTKYNARWNTVQYMVKKKSGEGGNKDDLALWQWLLQMLENLGKEGMSSDESAVEKGGAPAYRVKRMPWRRSDADKNLLLIDKQRFSGNGMISKKGNKPATRITAGDPGDSRRPAPPGRFRAIYNEAWLSTLHPVDLQNLRVSEGKFVWHEYYTVG
ncbi:hypothetical protein HYPSUDRAFT_207558 [Hypholoma sublateritium FD-334 SS-4]|uniref:Uncharacterized protein n=1 Tax=Hypholoma sublateritium (strain FD-334 SS-4) TaxID=945553 RepID=A0A0D2NGM1_HYPSF|nr:hypothetical protein HYPSUDRAFT_207558 [Hypholoma sublateritium FD-334 SS-4]